MERPSIKTSKKQLRSTKKLFITWSLPKNFKKTFSALSQDLLKAQKKALRKEHLLKVEAEKKRLRAILQVQYMLQALRHDHVQKDFKEGSNGAVCLSSKEMDHLVKFAKLSCQKQCHHMSLEDQMDQSSIYFWNLFEGSEKTVAGTTYKYLKELATKLLDCGYFESVRDPPVMKARKEDIPEVPPTKVEAGKAAIEEPEPPVEYAKCTSRPQGLPVRHFVALTPKPEPAKQNTDTYKATDMKYHSALKPWGMSPNVRHPEPRRWQTSPVPTPLPSTLLGPNPAPMLTPQIKQWEAMPPRLKKCDPDPKEANIPSKVQPYQMRMRVPKVPSEVEPVASIKLLSKGLTDLKPPNAVNGQLPMKRREVLPTIVANGQLPPAVNNTQPHKVPLLAVDEFCSSPTLPKDPKLRKQRLEDLIDQIKGTYNFMQDSMLDFDMPSQRLLSSQLPCETSVVSSEPKQNEIDPVLQLEEASSVSLDTQKDGVTCEMLSEPEIAEPLEPNPELENLPVAPLEEQSCLVEQITEASPDLLETLPERTTTPLPLLSDQLPSPKTPTHTSVLQLQQQCPPLSPRHTPVSMSSPFQGMQTVFKVNAPLPLRKEQELKEEPPYSTGYHQTFTTASTQTLPQCMLDTSFGDQNSFIQEPFPGSPYPSTGIQVNGSLPCYTSTPNLLPRMTPPFVSSRGTVRGTNRGRVITNGYRCPTGYKGPESYRGTQCVNNGNYVHAHCPGREYPATPFISRDGSSNLHKQRTNAITRTSSRGFSESSQMNSPEKEDSFNSIDSGLGETRSLTSLDMSMTSQAATILPVHVYPLPQQMRVAFSAARTSNFAPGTLDQPIVFDLLLNNLGDTFDFQVGRFMCPVNGTYVFIFHMLKLAVNVPLYVNLMKNEEVLVSAYANDGAPDHETASNHAVLQLFQGDQIWLRLHRGAIYGSSWKYSTFSGYLLYQD
ncbi:caprin family member 2 L homeolog [Xenopus laevis]|uniref:Caprin-2 n=1 Tax=Xenopus laevis TaxID=8355 RepID=B1WBD5_XENLA|nr:caprin family member 2 L homeolog [Xenopus laevis]AAI61714.1 LOC100158434 protein [Xenopus laevis]